jgi:hypothetical protein
VEIPGAAGDVSFARKESKGFGAIRVKALCHWYV